MCMVNRMQFDEVLQATLLLSSYFNKNEVKTIKPLTPTEYSRFASWLHLEGFNPANLLHEQKEIMERWQDPKQKITKERIESLLSRGASMGFAVEHWAKHGIWVIPRASKEYPKQIRAKIGDTRPPVLFGVGNKEILSCQGIGFVGSRSIDSDDEAFAKDKAESAVSQGFAVVSGGAKGIDQTAMVAAIEAGGKSIGILADSLLRAAASRLYRQGLLDNRLVLISPFYPEAGFSPGNAMARNKYIYAMSKSVVVVKSDYDKGGTWSGAKENLKKGWVPLLVRASKHTGNQELIKIGGKEINESFIDFEDLPQKSNSSVINELEPKEVGDLFANSSVDKSEAEVPKNISYKKEHEEEHSKQQKKGEQKTPKDAVSKVENESNNTSNCETVEAKDTELPLFSSNISSERSEIKSQLLHGAKASNLFRNYGSIFELFYERVIEECEENQLVTPDRLIEIYPELTITLVRKWLKSLEEEQLLVKKGRKLVYTITNK